MDTNVDEGRSHDAALAAPAIASNTPVRMPSRRVICSAAAVFAASALALYWMANSRYTESTEDAFVDGNVVAVTAQVGGVVTAISADNTDFVEAGTNLVTLDDVDAQLALAHSEALLAKTVRQVRAQYANVEQTRSTVAIRQVELKRAEADLARRHELEASGAISGEEVKHAQDAMSSAAAALAVASQQSAASQALVDRTVPETNPDVLAAATQVRDAWISSKRTSIPAPVTGLVTKRNVQLGQKITPGVALMSVVPMDHLWVNANFKESQLRHIRIGQPVTLVADVYGSAVTYTGKVIGQDAGTGSAFSLLPAQNATGNWIKIVQRVPVRIALDPQQVADHPLQLGLSMKVTVMTKQREGSRLAKAASTGHGYETDVFANQLTSADDLVRSIIKANQ